MKKPIVYSFLLFLGLQLFSSAGVGAETFDRISKCKKLEYGIAIEDLVKIFGEPLTTTSHPHSYWAYFRSNIASAGNIKASVDDHSGLILFLQCDEDGQPSWDKRTPYQKNPPDFSKTPELVSQVGSWEYRVHYLKKGTTDEGFIGQIYRDGKPYNPPRPEDASFAPVDTPLGQLQLVAESETLDRPNFIGGWQYTDRTKWPFTNDAARRQFFKNTAPAVSR